MTTTSTKAKPALGSQPDSGPDSKSASGSIVGYGLIARLLHWAMALQVVGMFALGYWMRTLDYYSPWYQRAPELHKSFGVILMALLSLRIIWRLTNPQPPPLAHNALERTAAHLTHIILYGLLLAMALTGFLFATGDGKPLSTFGLFDLPSLFKNKPVADFAGDVHQWLAYTILALAAVHMAGALKHHFVDRDDTLRRMVRKTSLASRSQPPKE